MSQNGKQTITNSQLDSMENLVCPKCDGKIFRPAVEFKIVSPIMSGTGREELLPLQHIHCTGCNEFFEYGKIPKKEKEPDNKIKVVNFKK